MKYQEEMVPVKKKRAGLLRSKRILMIALAALLATVVLTPVLTGCTLLNPTKSAEDDETPKVDPTPPTDVKVELTLYFPDSDAMYLEPEVREVAQGNAPLPDLVIQELVKGPTTEGLGISIPKESRLVSSVKVEGGVAYVNFNKEFQSKHWGGSTGEIMTIFSIVNSLTELEDIDSVVFLVEGERLESLAGHMDLTGPVERDENIISK